MNKQEEDELILGYLEHELDQADERRVLDSLSNPEFRKRFALFARDQAALYELDLPVGLLPVPPREEPSKNWSLYYSIAAIAATVMVAIGVVLVSPSTQPLEALLDSRAGIVSIEGKVLVNGKSVHGHIVVKEDDLVESLGKQSSTVVRFEDDTTVSLAGDTAVRLTTYLDQKRIDIQKGKVAVEAAKQPIGHPMLLRTETATLTVLGTGFALTADHDLTALNVTKGIVSLRSRGDSNDDVRVVAGRSAVAPLDAPAHFRPSRPVGNTWSHSFDKPNDGLIKYGRWAEAVEGATGVAFAAYSPSAPTLVPFLISTKEQWLDGLFKVTENSHLNFRVRMSDNGWYQVILVTRDAGYGQTDRDGVFEYQETEDWDGIAPNHWRTVSVPLSKFHATGGTTGSDEGAITDKFLLRSSPPPRLGDVAFIVTFGTADESRGLVLDRVWVTEGPAIEF